MNLILGEELRKMMTLLAGHVAECAAQVKAEKQSKVSATQQTDSAWVDSLLAEFDEPHMTKK